MDRSGRVRLWSDGRMGGERPALTFVVPAFNAEATLADTLRSLLAQTRPDWSAVVVDDGSTDGTAGIARHTDDPRIMLVSQPNRGLAAARNRGLVEANGDTVCFLDADDAVHPDFAEAMLGALEGTRSDLAACSYRMVGPALEDLDWVVRVGTHDTAVERLLEFNPFAVGGVVTRRSCVTHLLGPGPMFDARLRVHEDWDCWMRLTAAGAKWAIVDRPLFDYRITPGSMSGDLGRMWAVGLDVIARAPAPAGLKARADRHWTIRHIARAIARGDADLTARLRAELRASGPDLRQADAGLLAGSLRWALAREAGVAPHTGGRWLEAGRSRAASMLADAAGLADVLRRLSPRRGTPARNWDAVADHLRSSVPSGSVLVLYGMGRNGRDLVAALDRLGYRRRVAWMDDHPSASAPRLGGRELPRLRIDHLTRRHAVLVTPDAGDEMLSRLRDAGVIRVDTPESVLAHSQLAGVA